MICPCGTYKALNDCCGAYHRGAAAPDAEQLMRSRYSAYVLGKADYVVATTLPAQQVALDRNSIAMRSAGSRWLGLEVERVEHVPADPDHARVTFTARWHDGEQERSQHERSAFVRCRGSAAAPGIEPRWYYIDSTIALNAGRNEPCPCGSGRKFKKCCAPVIRD